MLFIWLGFGAFILLLLALDLGVFHREAHVVKVREAFAWTGVWLVVALLFAIFGRRWRRAAAENGYGPHGRLSPVRQAETTLAERFAKGDIDETEYRARLEVIRANAASG